MLVLKVKSLPSRPPYISPSIDMNLDIPGPCTNYWGIHSDSNVSSWAKRSTWNLTDIGDADGVTIIEFTRSPEAYNRALEDNEVLVHCTERLKPFLPNHGSNFGAKVFIDKHLWTNT